MNTHRPNQPSAVAVLWFAAAAAFGFLSVVSGGGVAIAAACFISTVLLGAGGHRYRTFTTLGRRTLDASTGQCRSAGALDAGCESEIDAPEGAEPPTSAMGVRPSEVLVYRDVHTGNAFWLDATNPTVMLQASWQALGYVLAARARVTEYKCLAPDLAAHQCRIHAMLASRSGFSEIAEQLTHLAAIGQAQALAMQAAGQHTWFEPGGAALDLGAFAAADAASLSTADPTRHARTRHAVGVF